MVICHFTEQKWEEGRYKNIFIVVVQSLKHARVCIGLFMSQMSPETQAIPSRIQTSNRTCCMAFHNTNALSGIPRQASYQGLPTSVINITTAFCTQHGILFHTSWPKTTWHGQQTVACESRTKLQLKSLQNTYLLNDGIVGHQKACKYLLKAGHTQHKPRGKLEYGKYTVFRRARHGL